MRERSQEWEKKIRRNGAGRGTEKRGKGAGAGTNRTDRAAGEGDRQDQETANRPPQSHNEK